MGLKLKVSTEKASQKAAIEPISCEKDVDKYFTSAVQNRGVRQLND